jgi:hypothetical protein
LLTALAAVLLCAPAPARGQAGNYDWRPVDGRPDGLMLFVGPTQVGWYDYAKGTYLTLNPLTRQWDPNPCQPPVMPPHRPGRNFGVNVGKVEEYARKNAGPNGWVYSHEGRIVGREQALKLVGPPPVGDGKLPDDGKLPRLTAIAPDRGAAVKADLDNRPELAAYKGQVLFQGYLPGDVMVQKVVPQPC